MCFFAVLPLILLVGVYGVKNQVLVLNEGNFDESISARPYTLVEFYAPWCGHCKKLAPEYASAARALPPASLGKVDCTTETALCERFEIKGFPTIKLIRSDYSSADYNDARTSSALTRYMTRQASPPVVAMDSLSDIRASISDETVVLGFFSTEPDFFVSAATECRQDDAVFIIAPEDAATQFNVMAGQVLVLTQFDDEEEKHIFTGKGAEELALFVRAHTFPLLGSIGPDNFKQYTNRAIPIGWLFVDYDNVHTKDVLEAVKHAAALAKGMVSFVQLDGVRWKDHMNHFGLSKTPGLVIEVRNTNVTKYVYDQTKDHTDADSLKDWVQDYLAGSVAPTLKSESPPQDNNGDVKIIVGSTFNDLVLDPAKTVFVQFYAPWCGHCKSLAPKWDSLGELFRADDSVVIAKIDATANDVPIDIKGFPSLVLFPAAADIAPITYEGERSTTAMGEFIRINAQTRQETAMPDQHDEL